MLHAPALLFTSVARAAQCLRAGGAVIFPTETFYGLGCLASDGAAVARIYQLKGRPVQRPLPLLAGDTAQAAAAACVEEAPPRLLTAFWPGPLTILFSVREGAHLPPQLINAAGKIALRVSSHPLARELALTAGGLLTSSSANKSACPPARRLDDLDLALVQALASAASPVQNGILPAPAAATEPAGGLPSTLVEPLGGMRLRLVRAGAVTAAMLQAAGFAVVDGTSCRAAQAGLP